MNSSVYLLSSREFGAQLILPALAQHVVYPRQYRILVGVTVIVHDCLKLHSTSLIDELQLRTPALSLSSMVVYVREENKAGEFKASFL